MWPTVKPRVAPEKRPSVSSATESPSPAPTIAAVTREHLAHAGPAVRPLVADHDDVARLDGLPLHRLERLPLRCRTRAPGRDACARSVPDSFSTRAFGREVAEQNHQAAVRLQRAIDRPDDFLARRLGRVRGFFGQRAAGDRRRVAGDRARLDRAASRRAGCRRPRADRSRRTGPTA